jgi:tRNA-Thr(GGU) m(6)t(6)A37 methyltransferase TsaA
MSLSLSPGSSAGLFLLSICTAALMRVAKHRATAAAAAAPPGSASVSVCPGQLASRAALLEERVAELTAALEKQTVLRQSERSSRISLQQRAREEKISRSIEEGFSYVPIGVVSSPFGKRCGTPRQPILCPAAKGRIVFNKSIVQRDHFQEIKNFSHIWVIWSFHGNTNADSADVASKVKPPRCSFKVGCLSTRSPHRPNAIGLSVVQVVGVGNDYIDIACIDMIDGTPVLDGTCVIDLIRC